MKIKVGEFTISDKKIMDNDDENYFNGGYWLCRLDGEGLFIQAEEFEKMIKNYYEENF